LLRGAFTASLPAQAVYYLGGFAPQLRHASVNQIIAKASRRFL